MNLDFKMRRRLFYRLLVLQSTWSFERMQGLGFAWTMQPHLERVYPSREDLTDALERHSEYFNTQPYVASLIVGLVCRLESEAAAKPHAERKAAHARIQAVKKALSSSLAGLGDSFFWTALRPAAAAAALAAGMLALRLGFSAAGLVTAAVYLLAYNIPALWLRWRGIALGYEWGEQLPAQLKRLDAQSWVRRLRWGGAALGGGLLLMTAAQAGPGLRMLGGILLAVYVAVYRLAPARVNAMRLYGGTCAVSFLAALAGWL